MRKYKERITLTHEQIEEIKEKFQTQGIELRHLAERFGVVASSMGTYISGRKKIPLLIHEKLKKILNLKK